MLNRKLKSGLFCLTSFLNPGSFLAFFFIFNLVLIFITSSYPIGDFGNYYYGSKVWLDGKDLMKLYTDIHWFNEQIKASGETHFFENYIPVPPFSLFFYAPFTFFEAHTSKLIFNLLSLLLFCFSLYRLIKQLNYFEQSIYLLPLIFLYPLCSNFLQGQAYLLISSLCMEFYLALKFQHKKTAGFIIALLFSLKIYPAFLGIILLFKRDWKGLVWLAVFLVIFQGLVFLILGIETFTQYYADIFPRLAMNEITDPFSFRNQSWHTFLLQCCIPNTSLNPQPVLNAPLLAFVFQLVVYAALGSVLIRSVLKLDGFKAVVISILVMLLMNKYSSVYGLLILFPVFFLVKDLRRKKYWFLVLILFILCNLPVYKLGALPLFFQFTRLWLLIAVLFFLAETFSWRLFFMSLPVFLFPALIFFKYQNDQGIEIKINTGVLYDYQIEKDALKLYSCMGERDTINLANLQLLKIKEVALPIHGSDVILNGQSIYHSRGQVKKPLLINDSLLLVMTDENRGVGMYTLMKKSIYRGK